MEECQPSSKMVGHPTTVKMFPEPLPAEVVEHNRGRVLLFIFDEGLVLLLHHQEIGDRSKGHAKLEIELKN